MDAPVSEDEFFYLEFAPTTAWTHTQVLQCFTAYFNAAREEQSRFAPPTTYEQAREKMQGTSSNSRDRFLSRKLSNTEKLPRLGDLYYFYSDSETE